MHGVPLAVLRIGDGRVVQNVLVVQAVPHKVKILLNQKPELDKGLCVRRGKHLGKQVPGRDFIIKQRLDAVIILLHPQAAVVRTVQLHHEVRRPVHAHPQVSGPEGAAFGRGVNGNVELSGQKVEALLLRQEVDILLVTAHGQPDAVLLTDKVRLPPLRLVSVGIADALLLPRVKGQQAEALLVGLAVAPIGRGGEIHVGHGIPRALEPLVLPGKHNGPGAAGFFDVPVHGDQGLALLGFAHIPLIPAQALLPGRHAPGGRHAKLGNHHGHGVVLVDVPQILQVGVFLMRGQEAVIIRIVGIDVIRGKLTGAEGLLAADMLHVNPGGLQEVLRQVLRVKQRVGGGPIGKGNHPLRAIFFRLIGSGRLTGGGQENLKVAGVLRIEVVAVQLLLLGEGLVRVGDQGPLPLHTQDVPAYPGGNVPAVEPGEDGVLPPFLVPSVDHIHDGFAVPEEGLVKFLVQGAVGGVDEVIVHPHAMKQVQRSRVVPVELVKCLVKIRPRQGVGADHVGPQGLNLRKPAQVLLLGNSLFRGVMARLAQPQVDTLQLIFRVAGPMVQIQRLSFRLGEILRLSAMGQVEHAHAEIEPVQQKQQQHAGDHKHQKLFHVPPASV